MGPRTARGELSLGGSESGVAADVVVIWGRDFVLQKQYVRIVAVGRAATLAAQR